MKLTLLPGFILLAVSLVQSEPIDRHALVSRHDIVLTEPDPMSPLQVGNGEFAFATDITGLQTFPESYTRIPLCTQSHWAWHTTSTSLKRDDYRYTNFDTYGRQVPYMIGHQNQKDLYNWMRENPHMLHLGRVGLVLKHDNGAPAKISDLKNIRQKLDLWTGLLRSEFTIDGTPVTVETCVHPTLDALAVRVESKRPIAVRIAFPYGSPRADAADWGKPDAHATTMAAQGSNRAVLRRKLDADSYSVPMQWSSGDIREEAKHCYVVSTKQETLEFVIAFAPRDVPSDLPDFSATKTACTAHWKDFWTTGGAIDLSQSTDPRARELERRIVLSQYATAINCAGSLPPQETGLVSNSWNGKFHLEMHWWHAAHFALWDRWPMIDRSLDYYRRILPAARRIATMQGYKGLRWPKMTDPLGQESPSNTGPLLIWQQPHPIFYAELDYRLHPTPATLEKWKEIVFGTADFLASYAVLDPKSSRYVLGPPMKIVSENTKGEESKNATFELSYWRYGLRTAQAWRQRLGMEKSPEWEKVLTNLAPLPTKDNLYLVMDGMTDTYTKMNFEHPAIIGVYGMLPGDGVDPAIAHATMKKVMETWKWDKCWGWDFPMMAMACARTGEPELAIQALLIESKAKNTYLKNGWNQGGPVPYFPGNGGLLYATAMMAAGWDGAPDGNAPGFPRDGKWVVKHENLNKAP